MAQWMRPRKSRPREGGCVDCTAPQVPGYVGYKGCHRCGSKAHRAVNCRVRHEEQIKKQLRRALRQERGAEIQSWLQRLIEDIKKEEIEKKERKERKKRYSEHSGIRKTAY